MAKVGIFYGSNTGNTEAATYNLLDKLQEASPDTEFEVHNIGASTPDQILSYEYIIIGIPTWNTGELQDDWAIFYPKMSSMDFTGKKVAIYGLGDQNGYGYNFLDAVGVIADEIYIQGGFCYGYWHTGTYEFADSLAQDGDFFMGLGIDIEGQADMSDARFEKWAPQVLQEFGILEREPA